MLSIVLSILLAVSLLGVVALMFSGYRYVIGYFCLGVLCYMWFAGMYWLVIKTTGFTGGQAYILTSIFAISPVLAHFAFDKPLHLDKALLQLKKLLNSKLSTKTKNLNNTALTAGSRPYDLAKDTSFYQHFVRHTSIEK